MQSVTTQAVAARRAALELATVDTAQKDRALRAMADALEAHADQLIAQNALDMEGARAAGRTEAFLDRLLLTAARVKGMADGLREVAELPDPVGEEIERRARPNGLLIIKKRVPLGVVGIIYESRPNVTVDAVGLCLKSGNVCLLRGGSDAHRSSVAICDVLRDALEASGLPRDAAQVLDDPSREAAEEMMRLHRHIDVLIPRGGAGLIQSVLEKATVPVIETGTGVCHIYVHEDADLAMAQQVAVSAKISRPATCNAAETLLVDEGVAARFLPECARELREKGVELRGCPRTLALVPWAVPAGEADWDAEYGALIYAVRVVAGLEEAIDHINEHGTRHSESILTTDERAAARFQEAVDAAAVYVNVSTRFTDGGEFGMGAEIGISNQKLHARGPMGLREMTTYKYLIWGDGQIR